MFTMNSFACYRHLALRSRALDVKLKLPRPITQLQMKIMCAKLVGAPQGPEPWHTFDVPGAETATHLPSITAWHHHRGAMSRLPSLAALGNYKFSFRTSHTVTHKILSSFTEISLQCVIVFQLARYIKFGNLGTCKAVRRWHITMLQQTSVCLC